MRIVFLGSPGVGKGTQAVLLCKALELEHLSTGDLLREAKQQGTDLGLKAGEFMDKGDLVPDEVILGLIEQKLEGVEGYVLDGFPRTEVQADGLDALLARREEPLDKVVLLTADVDEIVGRLLNRGRVDDEESTIRHRLGVYEQNTAPLVGYYRDRGLLTVVNGMGSIEEIHERVLAAVKA